ncbi:MAG: hypothetical protein ACM31C_32555 [Acidobacteriota bacterium]
MTNLVETLAALALVAGCGSSSNPKQADAAIDSKPIDAKPIDAASPMLTVKNAPTLTPWCSITVNGGTASTAAIQTMPITASGTITLTAAPESTTFELAANMWHHTDGDTGNGDSGSVTGMTSTAMVTVTAGQSKCVWVCCPFATNGTGCALPDQCP